MTDIKNKNGAVAPFPFASTLEFAHQQDPREFVWLATHGLPKIRHTKRCASETTLRRWEHDRPNANVGLLAGEVSGLTVVDIDTKAVSESEASALIDLAVDEFGEPRVIAETPSGGRHFYYHHNGERGRNHIHGLPIDIRAAGQCLVVAPPSRKPNAGDYRFIQGNIGDFDGLHPVKAGSIPEPSKPSSRRKQD